MRNTTERKIRAHRVEIIPNPIDGEQLNHLLLEQVKRESPVISMARALDRSLQAESKPRVLMNVGCSSPQADFYNQPTPRRQ